jgi:hypothetical protein
MRTAIVINTCPKYFYLLDGLCGLLRRYSNGLNWPVYLATEVPGDPAVISAVVKHKLQLITLNSSAADFFSSRFMALEELPQDIQYVLPIQDDFFVERPGLNVTALEDAVRLLDTYPELQSFRLMPCPGAKGTETLPGSNWRILKAELGDMLFCYQATIWRRETYRSFLLAMIRLTEEACGEAKPGSLEWSRYAVNMNPAETQIGQDALQRICGPRAIHCCWARVGAWANAVYQCPFPYRPTAVVKGVFQGWAKELLQREGFRVPS